MFSFFYWNTFIISYSIIITSIISLVLTLSSLSETLYITI
nr:MAG TPA: hypothetical protein [Crassvirales sp.]